MRVSFLQSHIGNGVSFLNKTLSAKLFSPNANAEGRCALLVAGGLWPGPAPRLRTTARDAAPAMPSVPAAKHRRAAGQRRHSAVLWRSAKRQPPALTCRPRSQLMLDFLREFRHGGRSCCSGGAEATEGPARDLPLLLLCGRPWAATAAHDWCPQGLLGYAVRTGCAAHRVLPACLPACRSQRVNSVQRLRHSLLRADRLLEKHEDEVGRGAGGQSGAARAQGALHSRS